MQPSEFFMMYQKIKSQMEAEKIEKKAQEKQLAITDPEK